jgi:hypothetical protein
MFQTAEAVVACQALAVQIGAIKYQLSLEQTSEIVAVACLCQGRLLQAPKNVVT